MTARALIRRGLKPGGLIGDGVRRIPVRFGAGVGRPGRVEGLKFLDALLMADASLIPHLREILREQSLELTFEFRRLTHGGSPFANRYRIEPDGSRCLSVATEGIFCDSGVVRACTRCAHATPGFGRDSEN